MDDIQEQNELATEISDALSTPFGINQDIDDVSIILIMYTCTWDRIHSNLSFIISIGRFIS